MKPTKPGSMGSLDEFLQPLEKSFQEARSKFRSPEKEIAAPAVKEVSRRDDSVLISLNEAATHIVYLLNPKIKPYEVIFGYPNFKSYDMLAQILPDAVNQFVKNALYPTTRNIQQENPASQLVFLYGYCQDSFLENCLQINLKDIIWREITEQIVDITRKICIIPTIRFQHICLLKTEEDYNVSAREIEIIKSAHGYEKR